MSPGAPLDSEALIDEALKIVQTAEKAKVPIRIFGAVAILQHSPRYGHLMGALGRTPGDVDFVSYNKFSSRIAQLIEGLGYDEDVTMTAFGSGRLIFRRRTDGVHCDVFLGKLQMSHTLDFGGRLELDYPTLPLADLFLAKMQIFKLNEKDVIDTIVLLREHAVASGDPDAIDSEYVSNLCSRDWGLWRTVTGNLRKVTALLPNYQSLPEADRDDVTAKADTLLGKLDAAPKSFSWKVRARVGDSRKWYTEVEDLYRR